MATHLWDSEIILPHFCSNRHANIRKWFVGNKHRAYGSGLKKGWLFFHPRVGKTPSLIAHEKWTQQSVSLWPTRWTQSVEGARQHLDSACDSGFLLHLPQRHREVVVTETVCRSSIYESTPKPFRSFIWRRTGQDNKFTLPSFIFYLRLLLVSPIHPHLFPSDCPFLHAFLFLFFKSPSQNWNL